MSSLRCKIGVHDWGKFGEMVPAYSNLTQFRECTRCGLIVYSSCYGNQADPKMINDTVKAVSIDEPDCETKDNLKRFQWLAKKIADGNFNQSEVVQEARELTLITKAES